MAEVEYYQGALTGQEIDALPNRLGNRNLLDNWYFAGGGSRLPINSRGQTVYQVSGTEATIDRWILRNSNGAGSPSVTVQNDGVQVSFNAKTASNLQSFMQNVSDFYSLAGKTVTLSCLIASNSLSSGSCIMALWNSSSLGTNNATVSGSSVSVVGVTGLVTKTCTLPNPFTNPYLNMGIFSTDGGKGVDGTIKFVAMKLELGDKQTLAHQENGEWVLNEVPDYTVEEINSFTSTANPNDTYANKSVEYTDRFVVVDSEYIALNPWPNSTYYYQVLTAPTGYQFVSATITRFAASNGVLPVITLGSSANVVYLVKPTDVTFASSAKAQVRALAIKI